MNNELAGVETRPYFGYRYRQVFFLAFAMFALLWTAGQPAEAAKIFNVKNAPFFAQGNGVADDTNAIQSAINAAAESPGSTVFFPNGTYFHEGELYVSGNKTTLQGFNRQNCRLTGNLLSIGGSNTNLSTFTIQSGNVFINEGASKVSVSACTFLSNLQFVSVTDCSVKNCDFTSSNNTPLSIYYSTRVEVANSKFAGGGEEKGATLAYVQSSSEVAFKQSQFSSEGGYPLYANSVDTILVDGCNVQSSGSSIYLYYCNNVTVRSNVLGSTQNNPATGTGLFLYYPSNVLVFNNKINYVFTGIYASGGSQVQILANALGNIGNNGIITQSDGTYIANNQVLNAGANGIECNVVSSCGSYKVEQNRCVNCGLSEAFAAIIVGYGESGGSENRSRNAVKQAAVGKGEGGGSSEVSVRNNVYLGNKQNIGYFIYCSIPSPPAVVKGNLTTTMLPTFVPNGQP